MAKPPKKIDYEMEIKGPEPAIPDPPDTIQLSEKEQAEAVNSAAEALSIPGVDFSKISDTDYLSDIFDTPFDSYNSLKYLKKMKGQMLKEGYPDTPLLSSMLFVATVKRRIEIEYQRIHKIFDMQGQKRAEDLDLLKEITDLSETLAQMQRSMDIALTRKQQTQDVYSMHDEVMKASENYIRDHIGEFTFMCHGCNTILNTQGIEHWAIRKESSQDGSPIHYVFSPEIWFLIEKKLISLEMGAFILRTSIEGIILTAQQRKEHFVPKLSEKQFIEFESKLRDLMIENEEKVRRKQQGYLPQ